MANGELDPLLEEQQAPWEAVEDLESGNNQLNLKSLFASHNALDQIATLGVAKLGEFTINSDLVYAAFEGSPIITYGSQHRNVDYERTWRERLRSSKTKPTGWSTDVTVEAYVVAIPDAADPDKDGLIQPLLRRHQAGACSLAVFGLPAVQATIHFKWDAFARRLLIWQAACFMVWLAAFYGFTWLFQDEDLSLTFGQLLETRRGAATVVLEFIALLAMMPFIVLEQGTLAAYGVKGWFNVWNGLDMITYVIQIAVTVMHVGRFGLDSNYLSILLALQCIMMLFRSQYYSRVFKSTRFAFLEAVRDVIAEIKYYFVFLLVIIFGFAAAFHVLFRRDQNQNEHFDSLPHSFLAVYAASTSGLSYDEMLASHVPVFASILNLAYAFVMGMVLINLLIGVMTDALAKVTEHEALKLLCHKAAIIDEMEATLPRWLEDRFEGTWYPKWIHILRIDPSKEDHVDAEAIWEPSKLQVESAGGGGGGSKHGGAAVLAQLEESKASERSQIEAIQRDLAALSGGMEAQLAEIKETLNKLLVASNGGGSGPGSGMTTPEKRKSKFFGGPRSESR